MNRLFSSFAHNIWLAWLVFSGALLCCVAISASAAEWRGQPIEFSPPIDQLVPADTSLQGKEQLREELSQIRLAEDLASSLGVGNNRGSLDGVSARAIRPTASPPVQNQKVKELLDRQKNWAFMMPDELQSDPVLEDLLGVKQYDQSWPEQRKATRLERYYESLGQEKLDNTKRNANGQAAFEDVYPDRDFPKSSGSPLASNPLMPTETQFGNLFGVGQPDAVISQDKDYGIFSRLFDPAGMVGAGRTPAQKARLEEFKQLLEPRLPASSPAAVADPFGQQAIPANPYSMLNPPSAAGVTPSLGGANINAAGRPGALSEFTTRPTPLTSPSATSSMTPLPPPANGLAGPATLQAPKRKF